MKQKLVDYIVRQIFKWDRLSDAIFDSVNLSNSIKRIMEDPESSAIAAAFWEESDGWHGWKLEGNTYYFNDVPEHSFLDQSFVLDEMLFEEKETI